jgi:hypothetical protein
MILPKITVFTSALAFTLAPALVHAATLTAVPMQGGMVMPMIAYRQADRAVHVMVDPTVPQLTPLLVSNPADRFDPADPWFDALDPSRQGLAFSRRYGFVMDSMTDLLPDGTQIWIRKLSSSPGLFLYRCANTAPKSWQPIFGTDGTTNALYWNGMMFHPAATALPGTNTYTATFEAYLVDTNTGQEVAGSSTGPFDLNWSDTTDGRPSLSIGSRIVVFCPASAPNWVLQSADCLTAANWTTVTNTPVLVEGQSAVVFDCLTAQKYFRMGLAP